MRAAAGRAETAPGAIAQMMRRVGIAKKPSRSTVPGWRNVVNRPLTQKSPMGAYVADGAAGPQGREKPKKRRQTGH